jgi:hypothetical protein
VIVIFSESLDQQPLMVIPAGNVYYLSALKGPPYIWRHMSNRASALVALVAVLALGIGFSVRAQRGGRRNRLPENSQMLESIKRLACSFSAATAGVWNEQGSAQAQTKERANGATVTITSIDVQDGTAEIGGSLRGGDNVNVKLAGSTLHFLDIGLNGSLTVITVFAKETHDGRLQAVYSHAAYVQTGRGTTPSPEATQYYGDCVADR